MPTFTHPLALWALLGIPLVLAIHFLQRRSRRMTVTTLFLLQQLRRESEKGNRVERLRVSIPLWLQLLMVLLITWLLAGPTWLKKDAVQRLAIVLDSSASMQAFREETTAGLRKTLSNFVRSGARSELTLLVSDSGAASLYHGGSLTDLKTTLAAWNPVLGVHDFTPALRSARSLVGPQGSVLLITDHPLNTPPAFEARVLSVGHATANVGWAGVSLEEKDGQWLWRALLCNDSDTVQERQWHAESQGRQSAAVKVTLAPRETRALSGPFTDEQRLTLVLSSDALTLDDRLPIVLPRPKALGLHLPAAQTEQAKLLADLFALYPHTSPVEAVDQADIRILTWPPSIALEPNQNACVFAAPSRADNPPSLTGSIVAEVHPLMDGLNWQSLLVREGMVVPRDDKDLILLWQGQRPLISLRQTPAGARQLFCHFDLVTSNARKLPALAVLLHRFLEEVRQAKIAPETANFDLRQRLSVAHRHGATDPALEMLSPEGLKTQVPVHQAHLLRAPATPGFFEIRQADQPLLSGAAHFADTREADLSKAAPFDETDRLNVQQIETLQENDPHWRLWTLLLLALLLGSWWWGRDKATARAQTAYPAAS